MAEPIKIPDFALSNMQSRMEEIQDYCLIFETSDSDSELLYATRIKRALSLYEANKITFKELVSIARKNGVEIGSLATFDNGIDYAEFATYDQTSTDTNFQLMPALIGRIMHLHFQIMLKYRDFLGGSTNEEDVRRSIEISNAISKYTENEITFRELDRIARKNGVKDKPLNVVDNGLDYSEIATYQQISNVTEDDINKDIRGYKFNGTPAHPEMFNIEIDKFTNKNNGEFKYSCADIGGQRFSYCYSLQDRDGDDGDFWIVLKKNFAWTEDPDSTFEIKVVDEDGDLLELDSSGIRLSRLIDLSRESNQYEMAFVDKDHFTKKRELTAQEIDNFKSYTRAFIESLEGGNDYVSDLERLKTNNNVKPTSHGCMGVLLLPIIGFASLLIYLFS